ncbi:hypothetical protein [Noviherbaspirillum pedocola]|uniref:Uncharacterized protein n=1 Tax=Noviherbaspirillum pedocola TaxID=2801341 RepID=A0A934W323_9BURK|nr:hypothetical protein [Noviherbaspirillum pedocola]MBK4736976.1 hypothetical protein [Noviherbaspirillum pedocola]
MAILPKKSGFGIRTVHSMVDPARSCQSVYIRARSIAPNISLGNLSCSYQSVDPAICATGISAFVCFHLRWACSAVQMQRVSICRLMGSSQTPDAIRGRVGAVNSVFIGASNELGKLKSGITPAGAASLRCSCSASR